MIITCYLFEVKSNKLIILTNFKKSTFINLS